MVWERGPAAGLARPAVDPDNWLCIQHPRRSSMATGWAGDGAVQDQIDATVKDAIERARSRLGTGPGREDCEECGEAIPEARRKAVPGGRLCIACPAARDGEENGAGSYNRRGSKDSQLRRRGRPAALRALR